MRIIELRGRQHIADNGKVYIQLGEPLKQLRRRKLPHEIIEQINLDVEEANDTTLEGNELKKLIKQKQTSILKLVERELKIVPQKSLPPAVVSCWGVCVWNTN